MRKNKHSKMAVICVVIIFSVAGLILLARSSASSAFYALDAEKGTISAPASLLDDSTAGSSQAIRFGTGNGGGTTPPPPPVPSGNTAPWGTAPLYVEPAPGNTAKAYVLSNPNATGAYLIQRMGAQPIAKWFGAWNGDVRAAANDYVTAARAAGQIPMLVLYNIPSRDCGGFSAGGAQTEADYAQWVNQLVLGVNGRSALFIIEPDAIALTDCLTSEQLSARYRELSNAVTQITARGNAYAYIDAGHANWVSASDTASRLKSAGIANATGFALNVSNYTKTSDNESFGNAVSTLVGHKHYVIDTSRNGNGPTSDNQWCNPPGRALGFTPTTKTTSAAADAYLWIKTPWASDGSCNGGPPAGEDNWPYAIDLAKAAGW